MVCLDRGDNIPNAGGWVWKTSFNRTNDLHRANKRTEKRNKRFLAESAPDLGRPDPVAFWATAESQLFVKGQVRDALAQAPDNYRRALQRHYFDGEAVEDIAEAYYLDMVSSGAVELADPTKVALARKQARNRIDQHLKRGRDWLKKHIAGANGEEGN